MTFLIAETFTDSLARLTGEEQKATTAFDLQLNPVNPGMSFHKLDKIRDKNFWSVRVTADLRLIVLKTADSLLLCYVAHHDRADEAQDIGIAHVRFFAAIGGVRPNALFFAGDLGQRIFQQPFSWRAVGVDVRGRSRTLRVNYRTSHQIRRQADRLLDPEISDVDGNVEVRSDAVSVFNGTDPVIQIFDTEDKEVEAVSQWLT